jgi:hypothetical protein
MKEGKTIRFDEKSQKILTKTLEEVRQQTGTIKHWEFSEDKLVVTFTTMEEPIIFLHFRSAKAGLELYLEGYIDGYDTGVRYGGVD